MSDKKEPRKFDLDFAKNYGRELFGGAPDTIGQHYIVQAMRKQHEMDQVSFTALQSELEVAKAEVIRFRGHPDWDYFFHESDSLRKIITQKDEQIKILRDALEKIAVVPGVEATQSMFECRETAREAIAAVDRLGESK